MDPRFDPPIFILGLHRSGTTLLYQMLAASGCFNVVTARHVICFDDLNGRAADAARSRARLHERLSRLGVSSRKVDVVRLGPDTPEEYGFILDNLHAGPWITPRNLHVFRHVCRAIQSDYALPRPLLVKNPWDFGHERGIRRLIPGARFIYIHRNPMHLLSSRYRVLTTFLSHPEPYLQLLSRRYERLVESEFGWRLVNALCAKTPALIARWVIDQTAWFARRYLRSLAACRGAPRVEVRFEDLCARPNETLGRIVDHLCVDDRGCDYSAMIGPHASVVLPRVAARADEITRKLGEYARAVGYDLPVIVRELCLARTRETRDAIVGASS